jgi:hypothetical protein
MYKKQEPVDTAQVLGDFQSGIWVMSETPERRREVLQPTTTKQLPPGAVFYTRHVHTGDVEIDYRFEGVTVYVESPLQDQEP